MLAPAQKNSRLHWLAGIILGLGATGGGALIFFFNPAVYPFFPVCHFHRLTGLNCPGCGLTRAVYAFLHGDWRMALRDNAFFLLTFAGLLARVAWMSVRKFLGRPAVDFLPLKFLWPWLVAAFVFTLLRNLPAFNFLSPV